MEFADRTVVVTGAAGNLGRAVAAAFAARGANLALIDRSEDLLRKVYPGDESRRLLVAADLLDAAQTQAAIARAAQRFGRIDVLANIAGGFRMGEAVHETTDATWNFLLDINMRTLLNTVRAVVPQMLAAGGGKIVNVGAASALKGAALMGAYVAAKSAVIRLTETMALELRERNVNVNCVLPTIIDTPENRAAMPDADPKRWVAPEALADVIVFLASDAARAVHGAA
ncbi:MAG TPA: SDR family NAD(P)-dependent oxidoreductase, partial [Burkholderiaceae bacterium]|nr:SDR family NAD(P)-dependent oxidoreductase [Burkholderiaceae bacterium]